MVDGGGPVPILVSHDAAERTLIEEYLNKNEIPFTMNPLDTANSLGAGFTGMGSVPAFGPVQIAVPAIHAQKAHDDLLGILADAKDAAVEGEEVDPAEEAYLAASPRFSQGFVARSRKPCEYEDYDRETAQA
ncbi:hypothetical protein [Acanthopleuribacter pedis]|uniref:Uncharacterized protein n=1 Tax=Acanthopleuribacter pedis TaxID=442870 RepID=A0A8J7Q1B1_9BACT|nr:hypothetical protein [Acanthopleuribacter pedis]MBO1317400.1 hypothetical protein [Acanthopleuribacter pedis]